jgi:hypothetical protein
MATRSVQVNVDGTTVAFELFTRRPASGVWLMDFERRPGR